MSLLVLALLGATIFLTSFMSGVFGMAGGLVLLGILLYLLDVPTAMVTLSVIQFTANGWRAALWWRYLRWRIFGFYVLGSILAFFVMRFIAFIPDKATIYLVMGSTPFLAALVPARWQPDIEWRGVPFITGLLTTFMQLFAGVGGLFLDMFFQKSMIDRKTTVATKAITQTFGHILRGLYFGSFGIVGDEVPVWSFVPAVALAIAGTSLAPLVLERMTDHGFRRWTRYIIFAISAIYLARAVWLVWHG